MHQPILAPDLSSDRPARVALDTVYGRISVPAWWAAEGGYSAGQTLLAHQICDAMRASSCASQADCCIDRITQRTRPMDPHIPPEDRRSQREFDAWRTHTRRIASARLEQEALNRQPVIDEAEDYHSGLTDDDEAPSAVTVWLVVAAGMTLVGLGIWLL